MRIIQQNINVQTEREGLKSSVNYVIMVCDIKALRI